MPRKVRSAFVMIGRVQGGEDNKKEDFFGLETQDFRNKDDVPATERTIEINKVLEYNYNNQYKVVITNINDKQGTAKIYVFKCFPNIGDKVIHEEEIRNDGKFKKLYIKDTDIVLRFGITELWQANQQNDKESDIQAGNLKILERITGLTIIPDPKMKKLARKINKSAAKSKVVTNINKEPEITPVIETPEAPNVDEVKEQPEQKNKPKVKKAQKQTQEIKEEEPGANE